VDQGDTHRVRCDRTQDRFDRGKVHLPFSSVPENSSRHSPAADAFSRGLYGTGDVASRPPARSAAARRGSVLTPAVHPREHLAGFARDDDVEDGGTRALLEGFIEDAEERVLTHTLTKSINCVRVVSFTHIFLGVKGAATSFTPIFLYVRSSPTPRVRIIRYFPPSGQAFVKIPTPLPREYCGKQHNASRDSAD